MFDLSAYALRFLEYLVIMVLFGVPLFGWYGSRRSALADALAGWSLMGVLLAGAVAGLVLTGLDVVFKTAGIMGMPLAEVDRASLGWYLLETSAGRAAMARRAAGRPDVRARMASSPREGGTAFPLGAMLAGGALASLAWNGHAAAGEGLAGAVRLAAGIVHLLAAGGWIAAVLMFLAMLLRGKETNGSGRLRSTHDFLHGFRRWERSSLVRSSCPASRTTGISPRGRFRPCSRAPTGSCCFSNWPCSLECWVWERCTDGRWCRAWNER